jgi:hypothetical protein
MIADRRHRPPVWAFKPQAPNGGDPARSKETAMSRQARCGLALLLCALCIVKAEARQPAASATWAGTWQLNLAESRFSSARPRSERRTIELTGRRMSIRSTGIGPTGRRIRFNYSVTLDGRFHPLSGNPDGDSIAVRLVDPRRVSISVRRHGRLSATAATKVSTNRLVMERDRLKESGSPSHDVLVYDRVRRAAESSTRLRAGQFRYT